MIPARAAAPALLVVLSLLTGSVAGADWPQWRYDAARSAASPGELPDQLQPLWTLQLTARRQVWDDPLNLDMMTYDRVFEPVVMDGRLFLPFNDRDKVVAYDTETGETLWTFFAEAPIRFPPVGHQGQLLVVCDDGYLYCLDAATGSLRWRFRGGPSQRHAMGNLRLVSAWPARGGPVVRDGTVYFAASIWPFMGTFIYALNADTGSVVWVNDSTAADYIRQPHSAPSFAGVAPQGALVATHDALIVPGGRSVPAVLDRQTGQLRYFEINAGGKGTGGSFVCADQSHWYVHTRIKGTRQFDLQSGLKTEFMPNEPVLHDGLVYSAVLDGEQPVVRCYGADKKVLWQVDADGRGDLILAGQRLYAASQDQITVIQLPRGDAPAHVVGRLPAAGDIQRLVAADDKLFAVSMEGRVHAFGAAGAAVADASGGRTIAESLRPLQPSDAATAAARQLLAAGDAQGYAYWYGAEDRSLLDAVAAVSPFVQLAVVDSNRGRIDALRARYDAAGRYGTVTGHVSSPAAFLAPPYTAHMVFFSPATVQQSLAADADDFATVYESVRPYGGTMYLLCSPALRPRVAAAVEALGLEQAAVEIGDSGVIVRRQGKLPGAADWTHQYGNIANTVKSDDSRVKLPLGLLWFGGSSNMDVLPRHGHGPPEQVIGGRLFIEGMNSLSARDVYTGRVLWKREFADLGTSDIYFDDTYKDTPLDTAYNQVHIPGANARGTNYAVTEDRVYIVEDSLCHVLDPATGESLRDIALPQTDAAQPRQWSYLGVYDDVLIGGVGFADYRQQHQLSFDDVDSQLRDSKKGFGSKSFDRAASAALVGFDRYSGKLLWRLEAQHSFWHNGIVAGNGRIYCLDKNPQPVEDRLRRRGLSAPDTYRILTVDAHSGETLWQQTEGIFGTWLGYSEEHDLLLQAGALASDRLTAEVGKGMTVHNAADGSVVWTRPTLAYAGPCILHHDLIITNTNSYNESAGAFSLIDGRQKMVQNPFTKELQPWTMTRAYGCNTVIASENLLTFRSGAAGFYDLTNDGGTGNLGGFKSGCTSNLVVANGVLNAPDYTRTCSCGYQNQTSLALVHMPELEIWTIHPGVALQPSQRFEQLALNFGAPGDRRDEDGLLWVEYPAVAGDPLPLQLTLQGDPQWYRRHASAMPNASHPWIQASGCQGLTGLRLSLTVADADSSKQTESSSDRRPYRLRLLFGAPDDSAGKAVFDVRLDGETVIENVTLDPAGPADTRAVVHQLDRVLLGDELAIDLVTKTGTTVLSGLSIERLAE